jgi:LacI family transcriptional regulator
MEKNQKKNDVRKKNVSLKTIAFECGVSINTVSRALRDKSDISDKTKSRVRQKAIELGYMPNHISQNLKTEERLTVAVLINSFDNLYYNLLCKVLINIFRKRGELEFVLLYSSTDSSFLTVNEIKQCVLQRIDLIVSHLLPTEEAIEFATLNKIYIVTVGSLDRCNRSDNVTIDNKMGCIMAARYLSNFHNNGRFLYVGINYFNSDDRYNFFRQELIDGGDNDVIYFNTDKEDIFKLFEHISNGYKSIFFYNDAVAYETLSKLDKLVINIRKMFLDLHLIGFDGLCESVYGLRQISTIKIDFPKYAHATYSVIKHRLEYPNSSKQNLVLPVTLHQRVGIE